jgi:acyl-CoA thioester hydrolase
MSDSAGYEHRSDVRVRYAETDQMGVVYHANYLVWCEIGRTDFIRARGRSYADMERDGITLAVSDAALRFVGSARYDDLVHVFTRLERVGSRGMTFAYRIVQADTGRTLVRATTSLVALDAEGRPSRLPAAVLDTLGQALATPAADAGRSRVD